MTRKRETQVIMMNSGTIIAYAYQLDATCLDINTDVSGTGIKCVFDQFLDDGRRALNHLTCSYLVG